MKRAVRVFAGVAQLVERNLAKVGAVSSNLIARTLFTTIDYVCSL